MYYRIADGHGLPHDPLKAIVAPRPIGWISTMSREGAINLAPYSFFNMLADRPALVGFSSQGCKDSMIFAEEGGEFVVNVASWRNRDAVNASSAPVPRGQSEFERFAIPALPCDLVRPPRVASSPAALECKWVQTIALRGANGADAGFFLVIGEIVGVHIDDGILVDGLVDTAAMRPVMRGGYRDFFDLAGAGRLVLERPVGGGRSD